MTVDELIAALQQCPSGATVVLYDYTASSQPAVTRLRHGEVREVRLRAEERAGLMLLELHDDGPFVGVMLGAM